MATYPQDRFDSVPDDLLRSGAHRGSAQKGHGWVVFAGAALATGALIVAGLIGLAVIRGTIELPFFAAGKTSAPTLTSKPTAVPSINPALSITILNGTETNGLQKAAGDNLVKQGWAGASADTGSRANAATRNLTKTLVYYSDPANEGAARALVVSLKVGDIRLSGAYPQSPLTVVLGSDYVAPTK